MKAEKAAGISLWTGYRSAGGVAVAAFVNIGASGFSVRAGDRALDVASIGSGGDGAA